MLLLASLVLCRVSHTTYVIMNSAEEYNTVDLAIFKDVTKFSLGVPLALPEPLVLFGESDKCSYPISLCCIQTPYFLFCKEKNYPCLDPFESRTITQ